MSGTVDWQDLVAILIAVVAVAWLARASLRRLLGPGCGSCRGPQGGHAGGFVSLEEVRSGASRIGSDPLPPSKRIGAAQRPPRAIDPDDTD